MVSAPCELPSLHHCAVEVQHLEFKRRTWQVLSPQAVAGTAQPEVICDPVMTIVAVHKAASSPPRRLRPEVGYLTE